MEMLGKVNRIVKPIMAAVAASNLMGFGGSVDQRHGRWRGGVAHSTARGKGVWGGFFPWWQPVP
jgi:hypothetical protein